MSVVGGSGSRGATGVVIGVVRVGFPWSGQEFFCVEQTEGRVIKIIGYPVDHPLFGAIGVDRADHAAERVIIHGYLLATLSLLRSIVPATGKARFVLLDDPALVVVDLPATHHNVWC